MAKVALTSRPAGSFFRRALWAAVFVASSVSASAQCPTGSGVAKTWLGTTSDWSTGSNWNPAGVPGVDDLAVIPAGTANDPQTSVSVSACGVQIATGATLTINNGDVLTLSGSLDVAGTGQITGAGDLVLAGGIAASLGAASLNVNVEVSSGTVSLGTTTLGQDLLLSGGTLNVAGGSQLDVSGDVDVAGGTLAVAGAVLISGDFTGISGQANGAGLVSLVGGANSTLEAAAGVVTVAFEVDKTTTADRVDVSGGGFAGADLTITEGTLRLQNGDVVDLAGDLTLTGGDLELGDDLNVEGDVAGNGGGTSGAQSIIMDGSSNATLSATAGVLDNLVEVAKTGGASVAIASGTTLDGRLRATSGTVTTSGTATLQGAAPSLDLAGGTFSVGGAVAATNGVEASGASTLSGSGALTASVSITGGTLTIEAGATPTVAGAIDVGVATLFVAAGATLTAGDAVLAVAVQNNGALIVAGALTASGAIEATGTTSFGGSGAITGDVDLLSGTATILGDAVPANASDLTIGDLDVAGGAGLSLGANATLHVTGAGGATFTGQTTLAGTGVLDGDVATVNGAGTDTLSATGSVRITGDVTVVASTTLDVTNSLFVEGDLAVAGTLDGAGGLTLDGVAASALDVSGSCDLALTLAKSSNVDVNLVQAATTLTNLLSLSGGRLVLGAGQTLTVDQTNPAIVLTRGELAVDGQILTGGAGGGVQASGTASVTGAGSIAPAFTVAGGTVTIPGGSSPTFGVVFVNGGATFSIAGGATVNGATSVTGTLTITAATTFAAAITINAGGVMTVDGGATVAANGAAPSVTANGANALLEVLAGATLNAANGVDLTNGGEGAVAGALDSGAAFVDLDGGLLSGAGSLTGAQGVRQVGGTSTMSFSGTVAGAVTVGAGALAITGSPNLGAITVSSGSLALDAAATAATMSVANGAVSIAGTPTVTGDVTLSGGAVSGAGSLTMAPGPAATTATLAITGAATNTVALIFAPTGAADVTANAAANTATGGDATVTSGTFTVPTTRTFSVGGVFAVAGATAVVDGVLTATGSTVASGATIDGKGSWNAELTATAGISTVSATVPGPPPIIFGQLVTVSAGATLALDGAASFSTAQIDGVLRANAAGSSFTGTANVGATGLLDVLANFSATDTITVSGQLSVGAAAVLTANGAPGVDLTGGTFALAGQLTAAGGLRGSSGASWSGTGTYAGAISAVTPGTFTLSAGSTMTLGGALTVGTGGSFVVQAAATFVTLAADGVLQIAATGAQITGAANVTANGLLDVDVDFTIGGLLTLTGGDLDVAPGATLTASAGGIAVSASASVTAGGQLDAGAAALNIADSTLTIGAAGAIPGALSVSFDGVSALNGPGTISVPVTIATGTTTAANSANLTQGFTVAVGATLTLASGLATPGDVQIDGTVNGAGALTMNPSAADSTLSIAGTYAGSLTIAPTGGFSVLLGAAPVTTIGGDVTVSSGTLDLGAGKTLAVGDQFFLQGATLVLSGGTLTATNGAECSGTATLGGAGGTLGAALAITGGTTTLAATSSLTFGRGLTVATGATFTVDAAASFTVASVAGTLDLNVGPTFSGTITITTGGTVDVAAGQTLTANGTPAVAASGGALVLDGALSGLAGLVLSNGGSVGGSGGSYSGPVTADAPGASSIVAGSTVTFGGALAVNAGASFTAAADATFASATVAGSLRTAPGATLTSTGPAPGVDVNAGSLDVDGALTAAAGVACDGACTLDGAGVINAAVTVGSGTTTVVTGAALQIAGDVSVVATATLSAQGSVVVSGATVVDGALNAAAGGVYEAAAPNTVLFQNGSSFTTGGTLRASAGVVCDQLVSAAGSGSIDAPVSLNAAATLTIVAGAAPTFTAGATIPAGATLDVAATGAADFAGVVSLGGALVLGGSLDAASVSAAGGSSVDGAGTCTAPFAVTGPGTSTVASGATPTFAGAVTVTNGTWSLLGTPNVTAPAGVALVTGALDVAGGLTASVIDGSAGSSLGGAGSVTADLTASAGTTTVTAPTTLAGDVSVNPGATLTLTFDLTVQGGVVNAGALDGAASLRMTAALPATLTASAAITAPVKIDSGAASVAASGTAILGGGVEVQSGTLSIPLGATIDATGGATLTAGVLDVDGTLSGSALTINGGTLDGSGTVDLSTTVGGAAACAFGGTFFQAAPPPSPLTLTIAPAGVFTVSASPKVNGPIAVQGSLVLSGGAILHVCSDVLVAATGLLTGAGTLSIDGPAGSPPPAIGGPIAVAVLLTGAGGVTLNPDLNLTGSLTIQPGAGALILPPGSTITLAGPLTLNGGSFQVDGTLNATGGITITADVTLSGSGAFNGVLGITGGVTNVAAPATLTLGGPIGVGVGAELRVDAGAAATTPGQVLVNGLLHVLGGGSFTANFSAPSLLVDAGTVDVDAGGALIAADGATSQGTGATLIVDGTATLNAGAWTITAPTSLDGTGQIQAPVQLQTSTLTFAATAAPTFGQSFDAAAGTTVALTAGAAPTANGAVTCAGLLQIPSGASFTAAGAAPGASFTAAVVDLDGVFGATNGASCAGAMSLDGAGQWNGPTSITGGVTTLLAGSNLVFGGDMTVSGGLLDAADSAQINGRLTVDSGATVHVATGETLTVAPAAAPAVALNGGALDLDGVLDGALGTETTGLASFDGAGGSHAGGVTVNGGTASVLAGSTITFGGGLVVAAGTFSAAASTSFSGAIAVGGGMLSVLVGVTLTAAGAAPAVAVNGGTVDVAGLLVAANGATAAGVSTFQGAGTLQTALDSSGTTSFPAGSNLTLTGALNSSGATTVGGALAAGGPVTVVGGVFTVAAGASLAAQAAAPAVAVTGAGLALDGTILGAGGVDFQGASQWSGAGGLVDGPVRIVSGTTTALAGVSVAMRSLLVAGLGAAATLDGSAGANFTVTNGGAALARVAAAPGAGAFSCGGLVADQLTVEGSFTKVAAGGLPLTVTGATLVAAGGTAVTAGAANFAGVEVFGALTATNGAACSGLLGVRSTGTAQLQGASSAAAIEVDGGLTATAALTVAGLFDVRAGGVATTAAVTTQDLQVAGSLTVSPLLANILHVTNAATISGAGASLSAVGPGALDVDGDTAVTNGGVFDATNGNHTFGGDLTCLPGGTLVIGGAGFTFDGSSVATTDCANLPQVTCAKTAPGALTLNGVAQIGGIFLLTGGDCVFAGGGTTALSSLLLVAGGTLATSGGTKLDVTGAAAFTASTPAVTGVLDLDLRSALTTNASLRPTGGTVTFLNSTNILRSPPYTGPIRLHRMVVAAGATVGVPNGDLVLRDDLTVDGAFQVLGAVGVAPGLDVRGDAVFGAAATFNPGDFPCFFAGDFTVANPAGLPNSASAPNTAFTFGPSADFLANPTDATLPPTNRSTLVRSDAALPSVVVSGRGTLGFVQLAEFAAQACPPGDFACTTTRALRISGTYAQTSDPGVTTLIHSSTPAPGTPSFTLDVAGAATFTGGGFLCCTSQDFVVCRQGATWNGATCDALANFFVYGDWTASPAFAPAQGAVEMRGDGSLQALNPFASTTLHFPILRIAADPGFTARREVVGGVRFEAGGTATASAVVIAAGAEFAVEPAAPNFFAAQLESVDATFLVQGTLAVGGNGRLNFGPQTALTIPAGGTLRLRGQSSLARAALGGVGGVNGWSATIGGTLDAERFLVEDLGPAGFVIQTAATLTAFTDGIFRRNTALPGTSYLLDLRRPAAPGVFTVQGIEFGGSGFPSASSNQTSGPLSVRTSLGSQTIRFENWSGTLGGDFQDDDPFEASPAFAATGGKVQWGAPAATVLSSFAAVGASSRVVASWTVSSETAGTTFVVERALQPQGPFAVAANVPCTGALGYSCVDSPAQPGTTYYYRLVEQAPGLAPRVLGTASATPFAASFASAPNVYEVGAGFGYATPQAAIDAAVAANVPGAVVRLTSGVYPSFVVTATGPGGLRVIADGAVAIDTTNGPVVLSGLVGDDRVLLHGLAIGATTSSHPALVVQNCAAPILVAASTLTGGAGQAGLTATQSYGIALDDVLASGAPGVALTASVAAAWDGSTDALVLAQNAKLRAVGFVAATSSVDAASTYDLFAGVAPRLTAPIFAPLGVPATISFAAEPNAPWLVAAAFDLGYATFVGQPIDLPLLLDPAAVFFADVRATDALGADAFAALVPAEPALIGAAVTFQGVAFTPSAGRYRLSSPAPTVVAP